jgi:succinoglycan biosynthesis transport protein ExoP
MDLLYFIRVLLRKKWVIILFTLLASIGAFTFISFKKDLFESVAQYSTGFTSEKVKLSDGSVAVDIYTLDIKFNNVIETFNSPRVIGMLSYKLMLHDLNNPQKPFKVLTEADKKSKFYKPISIDTLKKVLTAKVNNSELLSPAVKTEKDILDYLKVYGYDYNGITKMLIIRRVERTDYLDIIYQSENPQMSAYVVNTLGKEFINYYKNLNKVRNTESAQNIQQLLVLQQQKVDSLTTELKVARVSQGALDPVEQTKNAMETVKELQLEYSAAQSQYNLESRLYESYIDRIKLLNGMNGSTNGQDALVLFKKRDDLREQIARSNNPDPDLNKQLNAIEAQIKQQSSTVTSKVTIKDEIFDLQSKASESKAKLNAAQSTMSQLQRLMSASTNKSNVSPKTQVEIEAIGRQLEIENSELKSIREKYSLAEGLIQDDPTSNFSQTLVGEPDNEPVPKRRILTTGLVGISTFVITSLIFLMLAIFDSTIRTPTQFSKAVNLMLRGIINEINLKKLTLQEIIFNDLPDKKYKNELVFKNNIRKLRFEIEKAGKQVFLFTSSKRGVGKSTVLEALSYSLILNKKNVLVIDLNFENNTFTKKFNVEKFVEEANFTVEKSAFTEINEVNAILRRSVAGDEYIMEDIVVEKDMENSNLSSIISKTSIENLSLIGCKSGNYSPSEIASFNSLALIIEEARKEYDYIFLESASLNYRSDGYELFQYVDQIVTVFSSREAISQPDHKSIETVQNFNDKNFGAVLNRINYENMDL